MTIPTKNLVIMIKPLQWTTPVPLGLGRVRDFGRRCCRACRRGCLLLEQVMSLARWAGIELDQALRVRISWTTHVWTRSRAFIRTNEPMQSYKGWYYNDTHSKFLFKWILINTLIFLFTFYLADQKRLWMM